MMETPTCHNCRFRSDIIENPSFGSGYLYPGGGKHVAFCLRFPPTGEAFERGAGRRSTPPAYFDLDYDGLDFPNARELHEAQDYCAGFPFARKNGWCGEHKFRDEQ